MAWSEEKVFESKFLLEPKKLVAEYEFYLDEIPVKIGVRIYKDAKSNVCSDPYYFYTSHFIKTPEQAGPYTPSGPWTSDPEYALHRAVESLALYYREAKERGHKPSKSWLIPNDGF